VTVKIMRLVVTAFVPVTVRLQVTPALPPAVSANTPLLTVGLELVSALEHTLAFPDAAPTVNAEAPPCVTVKCVVVPVWIGMKTHPVPQFDDVPTELLLVAKDVSSCMGPVIEKLLPLASRSDPTFQKTDSVVPTIVRDRVLVGFPVALDVMVRLHVPPEFG
jgi:hypothetical protein